MRGPSARGAAAASTSESPCPPVRVVVPVRNAEHTIEACVDSLLAQDYPASRLRLVVVDNASTDGTRQRLRRYGSRIHLLDEPRRGRSAARNRGLRDGDEPLVAFIDADCVAEPGWLSGLVDGFDDAAVGMVGGRIRALRGDHAVQRYGEAIHDHDKAINEYHPAYVISMNAAIRRSVLDHVGAFDPRFVRGEDVDLSWRVARAGFRFRYAPAAVIYHHNEDSVLGLFREGAKHGYYGVQLKRHHDGYLGHAGRARNRLGSLRRAVDSGRHWLRAGADGAALYDTVFNLGKSVGGLAGSLRFRYFEI